MTASPADLFVPLHQNAARPGRHGLCRACRTRLSPTNRGWTISPRRPAPPGWAPIVARTAPGPGDPAASRQPHQSGGSVRFAGGERISGLWPSRRSSCQHRTTAPLRCGVRPGSCWLRRDGHGLRQWPGRRRRGPGGAAGHGDSPGLCGRCPAPVRWRRTLMPRVPGRRTPLGGVSGACGVAGVSLAAQDRDRRRPSPVACPSCSCAAGAVKGLHMHRHMRFPGRGRRGESWNTSS